MAVGVISFMDGKKWRGGDIIRLYKGQINISHTKQRKERERGIDQQGKQTSCD